MKNKQETTEHIEKLVEAIRELPDLAIDSMEQIRPITYELNKSIRALTKWWMGVSFTVGKK